MPLSSHILPKYVNPIFVESGTYRGDSVALALKVGFKKIISVEQDHGYYKDAIRRFEPNKNVILVHGNTRLVFEEVVRHHVDGVTTFWLDGHGDFFAPNPDGNVTPILRELEAILTSPIKGHTIMVDDMRIFRARNDWATDVSESDVMDAIRRIGNYKFSFEDDGLDPRDVLVATPI